MHKYPFSKILFKLIFSLFIIAFSLCLCSCGHREDADQVALDYYALITKQDASSLIALGMPEETAHSIIDSMTASLTSQVKEQLSLNGQVTIADEQVSQLVSAYLNSLKKLNATASKVKNSEGYSVTLSTNYIDYPAIDHEAIEKALEEIDISTYTDQAEYLSELTSAYIKYLLQGYNAAVPSTDQIQQDFIFTKQQGLYLPKDYESFTTGLFLLITHQA